MKNIIDIINGSFWVTSLLFSTLLFNSCGDADKIVTPRDIDTLLKPQVKIVRIIDIPFSNLTITLNGTWQRLLPTKSNSMQILRYSDSTWGMRLNISLYSSQQITSPSIDSLILRVSEVKANKPAITLENIIPSGKDLASKFILRKPGVSAVTVEPKIYSGKMNAPTIQCTFTNTTLVANLFYTSKGITEIKSQLGEDIEIEFKIATDVK